MTRLFGHQILRDLQVLVRSTVRVHKSVFKLNNLHLLVDESSMVLEFHKILTGCVLYLVISINHEFSMV